MSLAGRWGLSAVAVVFGGLAVLWFSYFFALFRCSWEGCATGDTVIFWVLVAAGTVALGAVVRTIWRR